MLAKGYIKIMIIFSITAGFIISIFALFFLINKTGVLVALENKESPLAAEKKEGVQSIIGGLVILIVSLILSFIHLPLIFASLFLGERLAAGQRRRPKYVRELDLRQVKLFDRLDRSHLGDVDLQVSFDACS